MCLLTFLALAANAHAQTWASLGPSAGETPFVVVAPSQPSTVLTISGNDNGGLFLTTNSGASWQSISAGLCDLHVTAMAFHPTTPATIYVATNSGGVCRTTDSGATWTQLASGLPKDSNNFPRQVNSLAINPATPATLIAGTMTGIYRSTDGGTTWTAAGASGVVVEAVAIAASTPATAYAVASTGVFKSTDSGGTWSAVNTGLPGSIDDGAITIDPTDANVVYLTAGGIYKTSNGGTSWATANTGLGSAFFIVNVVVDPSNPNILYVSAIGGCGVCKSTNAGGSWASAGASGLPDVPAFGVTNVAETMAIDPVTPSRLYAGTPAGVYVSTDSAVTWTAVTTNLTTVDVAAPVLMGSSPKSLLVATNSIDDAAVILKLTAGGLPFSTVPSPLPGSDSGSIIAMVVDPSDASILYALGGDFGGQHCPKPFKTINGGTSWSAISSGVPSTLCGSSLALDPVTPTTLYLSVFNPMGGAVAAGIYKTTNGGTAWTASSAGITFGVNRVAISPQRSTVLYAASGGQVFRSANSGANWSNASTGLPLSGGGGFSNVLRVAIDPIDDNIVYAATHAGVYRTTNGGTSWTARTTGWPTINGALYAADVLVLDPAVNTTIYATPSTPSPGPGGFLGNRALGAGLMKSTDSGATWTSASPVLAGVIVSDLVFDDTRVFAATNNGVFRFTATTPPTFTLDRTALKFAATRSSTALTAQTAAQTVHLTQGAGTTATWSATSDKPWLTVTPASGSGSSALTIAVHFDSTLPASGTATGSITLTLTGAANTVSPITVALTIASSTAAVSPPFGVIDTPVGGSTVLDGSIAVTGWTLDNVGVQRVELWRDLQSGETTPPFVSSPGDPRQGKVFIAIPTFVDGARPDVEALYPSTPFAYRAGWGYLLLTWGLWNQGNGPYTLYAFAFDQENNIATIGSKAIVVSNNAAAKPFGSIDTPAIGGEASGFNFGWALTPKVNGVATCKVQPSGAQVSIDSGPLQPVAFGDNRTDIGGGFPGFSNSDGAGGHYSFDWSSLPNGTHTIGWLITDDCSRVDGIGSRFFNVTGGTNLTTAETAAVGAIAAPQLSASALRPNEPESEEPITLARGFGELPEIVAPGEAGSRIVEVKQGERIEIRVPHGFATAYQLVNGGVRRVLPVGSSWDAGAGILSWQPAAGFLGRFRLVFSNGVERITVRVVVTP